MRCLHGFWKARAGDLDTHTGEVLVRLSGHLKNLAVSPGRGTILTVSISLFGRQVSSLGPLRLLYPGALPRSGLRTSDPPWMASASEFLQRTAHSLGLLEWDPPSLHAVGRPMKITVVIIVLIFNMGNWVVNSQISSTSEQYSNILITWLWRLERIGQHFIQSQSLTLLTSPHGLGK